MTLGGIVACLAVVGLLSSGRLLTIAERQEFNDSRERWITAAELLDDTASAARLDQPASAIDDLLYEDAPTEVVLGERAVQDAGSKVLISPSKMAVTTVPPAPTTVGTDTATTDSTPVAPTTTIAPATTVPTTAPPPTMRPVAEHEPLRVWAGGDSLGEYVGSRLQFKVSEPALSEFYLDYHISTGLTRPDYFDWPAQLSTEMLANDDPTTRPEALVFMVGGNDDQPMRADDGNLATNSAEWLTEYRRRVATMMDITAYNGVRLYWIGLPPMKSERREAIAVNVNVILAEEASLRDWVTFVDIVPLLLNEEGVYDQYIVGPDGESRKAREGDGVHVTIQASQWIAERVWDLIVRDWQISLEPEPASAEPTPNPTPTLTTTTTTGG